MSAAARLAAFLIRTPMAGKVRRPSNTLRAPILISEVSKIRRIHGVILIAVSLACSGDLSGPDPSYLGEYSLISIDGNTTLSTVKPDRVQYTSGTVTLNTEGTYVAIIYMQDCFANGCAMPSQRASFGTWRWKSSSFTLIDELNGFTSSAAYSAQRLTLTGALNISTGNVLVFQHK